MSSYNENFNSKLDWAMPFLRTGKYPLDRTDLFDSLEDALKYALGDGSDSRGLGKSSYIGLIITVYEDDVVLVYKIDPDRTISLISDPEVLSNYAEKNEIPTKVSQLENDANYATTETLNLAVQAVNSNINGFNQSINSTLQNVNEKANKADATATDALNLIEGIQGSLLSFALKSELPTKVSQLENDVPYVIEDGVDNGLYIYDIDGRFTLPENWNTANNNKAVGVAILTDDCQFVVAKEDISTSKVRWGGYHIKISTLTNYTDGVLAVTDFDGVNNTSKVIAAIGNTNDSYRDGTAAGDCSEYTFLNGKTGYLGAAGEWKIACQNKDVLNSALTLIGGTTMEKGVYWTSTLYDRDFAYGQDFASSGNGSIDLEKTYSYYVRAFLAIEVSKPLKERVSEIESSIPTKISQLLNDVFDLVSTTNSGLMSTSDKTKLDSINNVYYGVCNTEPSSAYKVVQLANIQLKVGTIVNVYHYYTNTATLAYLVINNLASYPIFYKWNQNISSDLTVGGLKETVLSYVFTGSNFCYIGQPQAQSQSSNWWWATGTQASGTTLIFNCTGFTKTNGMQITLPFTGFGWSALNMYLNINNTGACPVIYNGSATIPAGLLSRGTGGSYITVVYYNNNYYILSVTKDNLSQFNNDCGFVQSSRVDTIETSVSSLGSQMITGDIKYIKKVTSLPDNPDSNTLYILT